MQICVLMSTYNGEKYIIEQLNSIFSQECKNCNVRVIIRDDGSEDNTVAICEEYATKNKFDINIIRGKNVGPAKSFLELIASCTKSDFYAFCDQDDIWLQGKLAKAVSALSQMDAVPGLWVSNFNVVDDRLNTLIECPLERPEEDPLRVLFYNNVPGCTMVFNRYLLLEMQKLCISDFRMHDILALDIASITGKVCFEPNAYVLYRQHQNNALGYGNKQISFWAWLEKKIMYLKKNEDYHISEYAEKVLSRYNSVLNEEQRKEFILISQYKKSFIFTLKLLAKPYTHDGINRTSISIRSKILLRRF